MTADNPQHVVFIDSRVPDIQDLLDGVQPGDLVYVLDPDKDGIQQIADILAANNLGNLSTISIVSHGGVGEVTLGATMLTEANLADHAAALAEIGAALGPGGTLQLFGCDVGQGSAGQQFVNDLAMFAGGINVAAATHDVGSAALGGSWTLDVSAAPGVNGASAPGGLSANDTSLNSDGLPTRPDSTPPAPDTVAPRPDGLPVNNSPFNSDGLPTTLGAGAPQATSSSFTSSAAMSAGSGIPFTQQAINDFSGVLANPVQTELWITASGGGPASELIHVDDNGGASSINNTTLWTPTSANRPTQVYQIDDVALDPTNQFYFIVDANPGPISGVPQAANAILKGNIGTELTNPTGTPALSTIYYQSGTLGGPTGTGFISGIALDTANQQIYFTERHSILKVSYAGGAVTTLATGGTSVFADGLALDLPHNQAFFFSNTTFSTSSNGHPIVSVTSNAIYVDSNLAAASVVTPTKLTMSPADTHIAGAADFPVSLGLITGIAVDTVTEKLYFTTEPVADPTKFSGTGTGGIYEYDLTSNPGHTYHAVWVEPSNSSLFLTYIHIDDATNTYYVTDVNSTTGGGIYAGHLNSTAAPTLFSSIPSSTVTPIAPLGFAFDNAPSLSITPTNNTFTESTSNPASSNNTPVSAISGDTATDTDNTSVFSATVSIGGFFVGDVLSATTTGTSVVSSYNSTTGVLTLTGVDSFSHYQSVLSSVKFTSTSENPTDYNSDNSRTLTFSINDGLITSAPQTATVTVVGVNDPPTLSGTAAASFTENGGAKTLSSAAVVADPDSLTLANATVAIVGGSFSGDGDTLAASVAGTSITASYNSATETLTLTGSDTLAHYQSVLDSVTFNTNIDNPTNYGSNTTRTVTWQINDGSGSFNLSTVVTSTLNITAVNDPPTLTATAGTVAFTEGQAVTLSPTVTVTDPDNLTIAGATVKVAGGTFAGDGDVLTTSTIGTAITASYNSSTETLTLSGTDTLANYQAVLDKVTFASGSNPDDYGSQHTRTVTWVLNDGSGSFNLSTAQTTTVSITAINDPPALTSVAPTATYVENAGQVTLASTATVTDVDSLTLASATVKIVGGTFAGDGDVLAVNGVSNGTITLGSNTVTISYNSSTETLTLTGSDTLAHYQTLLEEVSFRTPNDNPTNFGANPTKTVTWLLNDGSGSNNLSSVTTTTISVTAVNDAPTLSVATSASFTENGPSFVLSPTVTVADPDNTTWTGATVKVAGGTFVGDGDVLAVDTTGTAITASYDSTTETLTLSGTDTLADYKQVLQSVTFVTGSENPTNYGSALTRTVTWVANDGSGSFNLSTAQTETVSITAINDAPTLTNVATGASYTELGSAAVLAGALTVADPDSLNLANATVQITGGTFAGDGDVLTFSTAGTTITASYNAGTETLTLTGSDSLAHYQSVLDSVAFSSTSHNPTDFGSNQTRTVTWLVNDGSGSFNLSGVATTTVTLTAVNDAPTLTGTVASVSFTENGAAVVLSPSVTVADPDSQTLAGATVHVVGGTFAGDGDVLAFNTAGTSITASYDATNETLILSGTDTLAHYQTVLDSVTFTTPSDNPTDFGSDPTRTLTWVLNDGSGSNNLSAAQTETINVTATNDAPTLSGVPAGVTFATGATITLASLAAASDPDNLTLASATVSVTGGTFAGDGDVLGFSTAGTSITASYNSTTETLTLTGSDTLAHYNSVLESITFASGADPSNANSNPTRTLSWTTNDGSLTSAAQTETITVQNTPAVNPPAHAAFTENQASVSLASSLAVTDPNSSILVSATVALTGGTFAGDGDVLAAIATGNITVSYDTANEKLILSGSDTLANYQTVLDSVTFTTPSDNPTLFGSDPTRTVTWTVVDDTGTTNATGTATSALDITAVNDAPSVAAGTSVSFTEGATTAVSPTLSVTDVDSLDLTGATVSITGGTFAGDGDVLAATPAGNITVSYDAATETLVLHGLDSLANYQTVLDSVSFASGHNPDDFGSSPSRTVTWTVNDGSGSFNLSTAQTTTIGVTAVNDPPTVAAAATDLFVTGQTITLSPSLSVTDPDNLGLASATVSVGGSFAGDGDVLGFSTAGTSITASYDSTNEVLTLTGSDTVSHYQQVLDSVTFASGADPTGGGTAPTRTITWVTNDGLAASAPQTTTVSLQLGPALFVPTNAAFTENGASVTLSSSVALTDSNAGAQITSATVAVTGGTFSGDGDVLAAAPAGNITVSYDAATETLVLHGLDSVANYQTVLDSVTFDTPSDNPTDFGSDPTRTVTWTVVDNSGGTATTSTATSTIGITPVNDAPSVAAGASVAFTEGATTAISPALSVTDVDNLGLVGATVSITGGTFAGDGDVLSANTAGTTITASYNSATETLTLTGSDTLAHYQQVLDTVSFASGDNPDDFGSSAARTVTWVLNDGGASFNLSPAATTTIGVTAVNDAPTVTGQAASVAFTVSSTVTLSSSLTVADPDSLSLTGATVSVTGGSFAGDGDVLAAAGITNGLVVFGPDTITVSYASATETLVLSGAASLAAYQTLLDEVTFASGANPNNGGANSTRTISWVLNDGSGSFNLSAPVTTTVDIAHIPPTLTNVAASIAFTQGNTTTLSPAITVTDIDSTSLTSATVQITGGTFAGDGDVLSASVAGTSITASYNAATETLTLTGSDTLAHYQSVLDSVKFSSGTDPTNHGSNPTRTLSWVVNDGNGSNGLSAEQDSTITITPLDAAPTLSTVATTAGFTENGAAVTLSGNLSVADPDSTVITSATVSIAGGAFVGDGDVLGFSTTGTSIIGSYDSSTETLLLSGADTLAHYKQVLDQVTFGTASENPTDFGADPTRTITWTVADDFNVHSAVATTTVNVTATNDAPTLTSVAPTVSFLSGTTLQLSPSVTVTDVDSLDIASATVKIAGGTFAGDGDLLSANVAGTHITASYDAASETLTLTGADPLATYQAVLESITFASGANPTNFGSNQTRLVTWVVNDGSGSNNLSSVASTTIDITAINTPPGLGGIPATVAFTEGQSLTVAGSASVADPDNLDLASATVQVTGGFAGDADVLAFSTTGTAITASYNSSTETLTLTGSDTLSHYTQVLDSITFASGDNPDDYGSNPTRVVTWVLNDGSASNNLSTVQTETISITAVNDPPTIAGTANAAFTENGASVTLSPSVTVSDPDSLGIVGGSVQITGGTFAGDGDVLGFSTAGTSITASYDSTTETLTLTGSDTFAHYQQVLDTVTFVTPTDNPDDFGSAPTRTITWSLNDGAASSSIGTVTTTVGITATNDAPTLSSIATSASYTEVAAPVTLSGAASVADPDNQKLVGATVKIVGGTFSGDGDVLAATAIGNITVSYNAAAETLTLTGSDTLAHYQQVLDSLTFSSTSLNPTNYGSNTARTVTWVLNDGSASSSLSATATETVSITAINNAPTLTSVTGVTSFTENGAAVTASPSLSVADPDNLTLVNATVSVANGFAGDGDVLSFSTAGTSITGSYNSATETLVFSGVDTVAHYQSVLDSVTFGTPSDNPTNYGSSLSRVLTWGVNDGSASSSLSAPQFTTVVITAINDAPTLANVATVKHAATGHTTTIAAGASVNDPDSQTLANATVKVTGGAFAGDGDIFAANPSGTSITVSYNAATETLVLSGSDTLAHYQQVLDSVTFSSGTNPTNSGANPTRTLTWTLNDGAGSNNLSTVTTTISISPAAKNDFNGDLVTDLLFQDVNRTSDHDPFDHAVQIWLMNNTSVTSQTILPNPGSNWIVAGTGDFNNDGNADILFRDTVGGNVQIWEMNGTSVAGAVALPFPGANWKPLGVGDFNGDGTADILWQNTSTGEVDTWFINNGHMVGGTALGVVSSAWQFSGIGDFNGDGTADVLWHNTVNGEVDTWLVGNGHMIGGTGVGFVSSAWVSGGIGDLNGDGTDDVVWRNTVNNEVDDWLMTNGHITGGTAIGFVPSSTTVVGTGDYNGDGKADILLQAGDGTPTIWTMNGNTITATTTLTTPGQNWHANTG